MVARAELELEPEVEHRQVFPQEQDLMDTHWLDVALGSGDEAGVGE